MNVLGSEISEFPRATMTLLRGSCRQPFRADGRSTVLHVGLPAAGTTANRAGHVVAGEFSSKEENPSGLGPC